MQGLPVKDQLERSARNRITYTPTSGAKRKDLGVLSLSLAFLTDINNIVDPLPPGNDSNMHAYGSVAIRAVRHSHANMFVMRTNGMSVVDVDSQFSSLP
jgi:hypothetical protein